MEFIVQIIGFFVHLDDHMQTIIQTYGLWTYLIVFLIVFCETGLVFTPFLPGDSLLFVLGALAAAEALELKYLLILLSVAAVLGDTVNYWIGHALAGKVSRKEKILFLKQEYLTKTQKFYEKYGNQTIILARFVPIVRTFAPFLAGVGSMKYSKFLLYNLVGGLLWVFLFVLAGYFFGNLPFVEHNFSLVIFGIIILSIIPMVVEFIRHRQEESKLKV